MDNYLGLTYPEVKKELILEGFEITHKTFTGSQPPNPVNEKQVRVVRISQMGPSQVNLVLAYFDI
ncbi:MAG: hypothetical protein PWP31_544 [Clostridia bacterium]|nr:hypothetical protein [Clostridia bacterium]